MKIPDKNVKLSLIILILLSSWTSIVSAQDVSNQIKTIRKLQIKYFEDTDSIDICWEPLWIKFNKAGDTVGYRKLEFKTSQPFYSPPIYRIGNIRYTPSKKIVKEKLYKYTFSQKFKCHSGKNQYKRNLRKKLKKSKWVYGKNDSLLFYRYQHYNLPDFYARTYAFKTHKTNIERNNEEQILSKKSKGFYYKKQSHRKRRVKKFRKLEYNADGQLTRVTFPLNKNTYPWQETIYDHQPNGSVESYKIFNTSDTS